MSKINALVFAIVGFILSLPFVLDMIFGASTAILPLHTILFILMIIPGLPMFFFGMIGLVVNAPHSSTAYSPENDLSRIRHAVETDRMERK